MKHTHRIKIAGGEIALVDAVDAHLVRQYRWHHGGTRNRYVVAYARTGRGKPKIYLHRLIMAAAPGEIVDHIDGDPMNNRRSNLRLVSRSENAVNLTHTRNETGFRGVAFFPAQKKYQGRVQKDGGVFRGPYRKSPEQAASDFDAMARGLFGDYATFNFPRQSERGVQRT